MSATFTSPSPTQSVIPTTAAAYSGHYSHPNPSGTALIAVSIIALFVTYLVVCARLYTKAILTHALGWDDVTCVLALIGATFYTAFTQKGSNGIGDLSYNVHQSILGWQRYDLHHELGEYSYFATIGLMKVSILLLYLRVFSTSRTLRWAIYGALFTVVASHVAILLITTLDIRPIACHWTLYQTDEEYYRHCTDYWEDTIPYVFMSVFTVVLDLGILAIPLPAVWKLNMPRKQKIAVSIIFSTGLVVTLVSLLRLIFYIRWSYYEPPENDLLLVWELRTGFAGVFEVNLGIICASLSTLKAFIKRYAPAILPSSHNAGMSSQSHKRSMTNPLSPSRHQSKPGRKWPIDSHEGNLTGAVYLELGEDGKSDQSYAMTGVEAVPRSS